MSSGYSGGEKSNPSYLEVSNGLTNHAEVCEIIYDDKKIKLRDLDDTSNKLDDIDG